MTAVGSYLIMRTTCVNYIASKSSEPLNTLSCRCINTASMRSLIFSKNMSGMTPCPLKGKADIDKYFRIELSSSRYYFDRKAPPAPKK